MAKSTKSVWISRLEAIELCGGVSPKTFDRWRQLPGFPKARKASAESRLVFFDRDELIAWLDQAKRRA
jgi:predicted DNA-binding transcriptional regulator AlpA